MRGRCSIYLAAFILAFSLVGHAIGGSPAPPDGVVRISDYAPKADGRSDDLTAFNLAFAECTRRGGGIVELGPVPGYAILSGNLVIPPHCGIRGYGVPGDLATHYRINLEPSLSIVRSGDSTIQGISLFSTAVVAVPRDIRSALQTVASFAGTAVTDTGPDNLIRDVGIFGFATCYRSKNGWRPVLFNVVGDCTDGIVIEEAHDTARLEQVRLWPYLTSTLIADPNVSYRVLDARNNGSGGYRLTLLPNLLQTGDIAFVTGIGGAAGANGRWRVRVVDSTHVDLEGSSVSPEFEAALVAGDDVVRIASMDGVAPGQTVMGDGIAPGTLIKAVWRHSGMVELSLPLTKSVAATKLRLRDGVYSSGGMLSLDADYRLGTAFSFGHSETAWCNGCFSFDWRVGMHAGAGQRWLQLINNHFDAWGQNGDLTSIGIVCDADCNALNFVSGTIQSLGTGVLIDSTGSDIHMIGSVVANTFGPPLEIEHGSLVIGGPFTGVGSAPLQIGRQAGQLTIGSGAFPNAALSFGRIATSEDSAPFPSFRVKAILHSVTSFK